MFWLSLSQFPFPRAPPMSSIAISYQLYSFLFLSAHLTMPVCSWVQDHLLDCGQPLRGCTWRKLTLPFSKAINCQTLLSWGQDFMTTLHAGLLSDWILYRFWICCHYCRDLSCSIVSRKYCFSVVTHCLWPLQISCPLFHDPWALGRCSEIQMSHSGPKALQPLTPCMLTSWRYLY